MLKLVSFIDSLPRVRGKKRPKTALTTCCNDEPSKKSSSSKRFSAKISKIGKRRNTVPENDIVKDLPPPSMMNGEQKVLQETNNSCWTSSVVPVVSVTGCYTLPLNRPQIRTNPWCKPKPLIPTLDLWSNTLPKTAADQNGNNIVVKDGVNDVGRHDKTLDDSLMCSSMSSGYGSRDSSPASSVHTPDWQARVVVGGHQECCCIEEDVVAIRCEDVGLQCNMTEDKSVDCTESDFGCCFENDDADTESDVVVDKTNVDRVVNNIRQESSLVITELNRKIAELQVKAQRMKRCVEFAKEERERRSREKQLCQEQLRFIRQLKLAISSGFEVIV